MKVVAGAVVSSEGPTGKDAVPSWLMQLLAEFISFLVVSPKASLNSMPHGLLYRKAHSISAGFLQN